MKGERARTVLARLEKQQRVTQKEMWKIFLDRTFELIPPAAMDCLTGQAPSLLNHLSQHEADVRQKALAPLLGIDDLTAFEAWFEESERLRTAYENGYLSAMPANIPTPPFNPKPLLENVNRLEYPADVDGVLLAHMAVAICEALAYETLYQKASHV